MSLKITIEFELRCDSCGKKSHGVGYDGPGKLKQANLPLVAEDALFKAMEKDGWVRKYGCAYDSQKHFCGDCVKEGKSS
jgi:hypothetical protein